MATLKNAKHERFAQALADGKTQFEAHGIAGYKAHRGNASALAQDKSIVERVAEIMGRRRSIEEKGLERAIAATALTKEWVITRLTENAENAAKAGDYAPSNKALELLGKEIGMFVDRSENKSESVVTVKDERDALKREISHFLAPAVSRNGTGLVH